MKKSIFLIFICWLNASPVLAKTKVDEVAEQYVKLALALGEHDSAYVDAYYGPKEWRNNAKKNPLELKNIIITAKSLQNILVAEKSDDEMESLRLSYLKTQLNSLASRAIMLNGEKLNFDQQSQALYNTQAPHYPLKSFEVALTDLATLLPGKEPLSIRVEKFQSRFIIPQDKLKVVFDAAINACRERTKIHVDLLDNENFTLEFVSDKPWSGYNWYKGNGFSLIQVNTELPIYISRAVDLGCHEGYPGHHTYNGLLEVNLFKQRGWVEFSVYPLFSPQSLIAEGSANYGIEMAFPGDQKANFEKDILFPLAGISPELSKQYSAFLKLMEKLNYAGNEVARLYLNKEIDQLKAQDLLQQYALMSAEKASQRVQFIDTYGAYVINYNWGKDMVKQWVEAGPDQSIKGRWKRFAKLLASPRLPSTLN